MKNAQNVKGYNPAICGRPQFLNHYCNVETFQTLSIRKKGRQHIECGLLKVRDIQTTKW